MELAKSLFDKGLIDARELAEARKNLRFRKQVEQNPVRGRTPQMDALVRAINDSDRYIVENSLHAFGSASSHVTAADGNVFTDLGFHPDQAAALLADADERMFKADYARMQHPVFAALSKALESTVPEGAGFGKFRGPPREPDDDKG